KKIGLKELPCMYRGAPPAFGQSPKLIVRRHQPKLTEIGLICGLSRRRRSFVIKDSFKDVYLLIYTENDEFRLRQAATQGIGEASIQRHVVRHDEASPVAINDHRHHPTGRMTTEPDHLKFSVIRKILTGRHDDIKIGVACRSTPFYRHPPENTYYMIKNNRRNPLRFSPSNPEYRSPGVLHLKARAFACLGETPAWRNFSSTPRKMRAACSSTADGSIVAHMAACRMDHVLDRNPRWTRKVEKHVVITAHTITSVFYSTHTKNAPRWLPPLPLSFRPFLHSWTPACHLSSGHASEDQLLKEEKSDGRQIVEMTHGHISNLGVCFDRSPVATARVVIEVENTKRGMEVGEAVQSLYNFNGRDNTMLNKLNFTCINLRELFQTY
ncbi:hypothetical protein L9F63_013311, partial [Diploptera punctata]